MNLTIVEKQDFRDQIQIKRGKIDRMVKKFKATIAHKSELEKETTLAVIRKLKHQKRQLKESLEGITLDDLWEDMKDNLIITYEQAAYELAEAFNRFCEEVEEIKAEGNPGGKPQN